MLPCARAAGIASAFWIVPTSACEPSHVAAPPPAAARKRRLVHLFSDFGRIQRRSCATRSPQHPAGWLETTPAQDRTQPEQGCDGEGPAPQASRLPASGLITAAAT